MAKKIFTTETLKEFVDTIKSNIEKAVSIKSDNGHIHDERYYTEPEVDEIIAVHTHSYDDLRNKPFYEGTDYSSILAGNKLTVNFYDWSGGVYGAAVTNAPKAFIQDTSYKVIWDGIEYTMNCTFSGNNESGNPITSLGSPYGNYVAYPFGIDSYQTSSGTYEFSIHTNSTDSTHAIDILEFGSSFVTLDEKFIPDTIARTTDVDELEVVVSGKANSVHSHTISDVANLQTTLDGKAASSHNHDASNISSGTLSSDRLPTVPISKGGTGATTASGALSNLGLTATAAELNVLDGITATTAELNYTDGVTSNIQTQLNAKVPTSRTINGKALSANITLSAADVSADASGSASSALAEAKLYADNAANSVKNDLLNNAGPAYDSLKELGDLIDDNHDAIDALEIVAAGKADKNHYHEGTGDYSTALGEATTVSGNQSTALGQGATITNVNVTAVGQGVTVSGDNSTSVGQASIASGANTIAIGQASEASGGYSISIGQTGKATGDYSIAIGQATTAPDNSTVIGQYASSGVSSVVVGQGANTAKDYSTIVGQGASATADCAVVVGQAASATGVKAVALGHGAKAEGNYSVVLGSFASATGEYAVAMGGETLASGQYSFAEGVSTKATDYGAHAEGDRTEASSTGAHAEGQSTVASGLQAHAEGRGSVASASGAHAEGMGTTASGTGSHSEGTGTRAEGMYSHAEGASTVAKGYQTHAEGSGTIASGSDQHVQGRYNIEIPYQYAHIVGNGSSDTERSNMHTLDWQGNAWYSGDILVGGTGMTSGASRVTTEADHHWDLVYDSGSITSAVNSFANIDISGYKNFMIAVKCVNSGNPGTKAGAVIFKATNGTTYQFPVWGNMFSATNMHCGGMGEFKFVDGYIVCPGANRVLSNTAFLEDTEGGTAANMIGQGGGIMKCSNVINSVSVSSQDQNSTYFFGIGSRLVIWGWNC